MSRDGLHVHGGRGGATARIADLRTKAQLADTIADRLDDIGEELRSVMRASGLGITSAWSPATAARAQADGAAVETRLRASCAAVRERSSLLQTVALTAERADRFDTGTRTLTTSTVGLLALGAGIVETVRSTPVTAGRHVHHALLRATAVGVIDGPGAHAAAMRAVPRDARVRVADELVTAWGSMLLDRPAITNGVIDGVATVHTLATLLPRGRRIPQPRVSGFRDTVRALVVLGEDHGILDDARPVHRTSAHFGELSHLTPAHRLRTTAAITQPVSIADLVANQSSLQTLARRDPATSRLRVIEVLGAGGSSWIVQLPGTQTMMSPTNPSDMATNLYLTGLQQAALLDAVEDVLRHHAVGDDPVMLVGHSQGGITAATFAAQADERGFNITHAVTFGAPIARVAVPRGVQVLALEHHDDPIPRLDGRTNPGAANVTTVVRHSGGSAAHTSPLATHGLPSYRTTAAAVDASDDPSIRGFLASADGFFVAERARGHTATGSGRITDHTISRRAPGPAHRRGP